MLALVHTIHGVLTQWHISTNCSSCSFLRSERQSYFFLFDGPSLGPFKVPILYTSSQTTPNILEKHSQSFLCAVIIIYFNDAARSQLSNTFSWSLLCSSRTHEPKGLVKIHVGLPSREKTSGMEVAAVDRRELYPLGSITVIPQYSFLPMDSGDIMWLLLLKYSRKSCDGRQKTAGQQLPRGCSLLRPAASSASNSHESGFFLCWRMKGEFRGPRKLLCGRGPSGVNWVKSHRETGNSGGQVLKEQK